ncbi:hypothetical protein [Mediterraneibacter gnavus]|uniref:Competence protein CoiA-like N-terminal domain-containing protein n=1 Tax=Mediterraneibacter gnavus TaxID=33038 RepID=A0A2N5PY74_MEDGN|nr:hypothetical protein [Mediterraneibacter gnavus]PLT84539.1 hypothetical protein CDL20_11610 [Mediterraneibacter gnavus]
MKTALDFYARGKQKEANADEYDRSRYYSKDRFICPECGEPVHLTGSKYSNHFAHYKKSDVSAECDRRVDGSPTDSVYERIGLPIYMRINSSGDFYLYMGFKALPTALMEKAVAESVKVKIDRKNTYRINTERFSCERTALIPLDYIPLSGHKYHLCYEPVNKTYAISQHWSDYADGFSYEGALFTVSEQGGKKIRHGDSITTDEEYYWVRRQSQLPSFIPGVKMEKCGRLVLKDVSLNVFRGSFSSDISDAEFRCLTVYLRTNLKIHLLEKQPEFIPVWPPVIRSEDGYIVNNREQNIYGYIVSGNDKPKVYVYNGIRKVPDELDSVNNMTCVKVWDQEALVNIDRKYISNGTLLLKRKRNIQTHDAGIYELVGDTYLSFQERDACKYCNKIVFRTENPTDFILVRSDGKIEKNGGIGDFTFEDLNNGDLICVLQSKFLVNIISVSIEEERCNTEINDDVLYQMFEKYKGTKKVRLPYKTRIQIFEMQDKVKLSRKHLVSTLKSNCISAALINVLEEILDE